MAALLTPAMNVFPFLFPSFIGKTICLRVPKLKSFLENSFAMLTTVFGHINIVSCCIVLNRFKSHAVWSVEIHPGLLEAAMCVSSVCIKPKSGRGRSQLIVLNLLPRQLSRNANPTSFPHRTCDDFSGPIQGVPFSHRYSRPSAYYITDLITDLSSECIHTNFIPKVLIKFWSRRLGFNHKEKCGIRK